MIDPFTPTGVEHIYDAKYLASQVIDPFTPTGVEHYSPRHLIRFSLVIDPFTPTGVEHKSVSKGIREQW